MASSSIFISQGDFVVYANPAAERIGGYCRAELMTMPFSDLIHPDSKEMVEELARARRSGLPIPQQYELKIVHKSGNTRLLQCSTTVVDLRGEPAIIGMATDITEQRSAEKALHHSEAVF